MRRCSRCKIKRRMLIWFRHRFFNDPAEVFFSRARFWKIANVNDAFWTRRARAASYVRRMRKKKMSAVVSSSGGCWTFVRFFFSFFFSLKLFRKVKMTVLLAKDEKKLRFLEGTKWKYKFSSSLNYLGQFKRNFFPSVITKLEKYIEFQHQSRLKKSI